ncbi:CD109 antigen-like [Palaemon carinicauda]|uniref:CD109 antigen-like n=1 Tax=Palaemon carinicauda TaxID=392227 RepID=UPI0035B65C36
MNASGRSSWVLWMILSSWVVTSTGQDLVSKSPSNPFANLLRGAWEEDYKEVRLAYPEGKKKTVARWLIVGGREVSPDSIYRVAVEALRTDEPLLVKAALVHDGEQVASGKVRLLPGQLSEILLKVPDTSVDGQWQLRVEGHEGIGKLFRKVANLNFYPKFLTILIQPSRPVYNSGQTVRFRAILLTRELKPYDGPVDVFVLDPRGRKMRRWPSHQTGHGVIHLDFELPEYPLVGTWTIRIRARSQIEDMPIKVEHYFRPRFEVFVRLPLTFKTSDEYVEGVVVANMTNWRYVLGNCTLKLQYATHQFGEVPESFVDAYEEFVPRFNGFHPFQLPLAAVQAAAGNNLSNTTVRVLAAVGDYFGWRVQEGWALARLVEEKAKVTFLGDQPFIFRPGMPATFHVMATYSDNHPLSEEELEYAELKVVIRSSGKTSKVEEILVHGAKLIENGGVGEVTIDIPEETENVKADAILTTSSGLTAADTLIGVLHHSPRDRHLLIETSTPDASPGQFITLHVRNNFYTKYFNYIIMSKGVVIYSGRQPILDTSVPTVTTFSVPASTEMAPAAYIVAWVVAQDGQLVAHGVAVPVNPLGRHQVGIRWNEHKDHSGGSVEMKMLGELGSFFAVSAVWEETHKMESGHDLTEVRVLQHMMELEKNDTIFDGIQNFTMPHLRRAFTRSRDGAGSTVSFFPTNMVGPDAPSTFNFSNLVVLTDADLFYHPHHASSSPDCNEQYLRCLTGGCYSYTERCDGVYQCSDHSDESGCPIKVDPLRDFHLHRISRIHRFYDPGDGDWAWQNIRKEGSEIQVFPIPKRPQNWVLSMFAVGKEKGLGLLQEKIQFDSAGPFMITLEGPKVVRQWEQVGLRACVFNFHLSKVGILITLPDSEDYRSVLVEKNGFINSYAPRTSAGDHQHMVWLEAGQSLDVHIPIVFTRVGTIDVTVKGSTMMQKDEHSITIEVVPEGVIIGKHTSILLDLKNRAVVYDFLDIQLDESPLIPYSLRRRYIYDTPSGHISITGDVVGPAFPEIPVGSDSLLGLEMMGAETAAFNFAANLWSLHYLRLTNQIEPGLTYKVLTAVNVHYAALARYQDSNGAFRMWPESEPSVWLTAYSLRTLLLANFQDWENLIYIDPLVIQSATEWILEYQNDLGSFSETPNYTHPLDSKSNPTPAKQLERDGYKNVSLTSQVVLALVDIQPSLQGGLRRRTSLAKERAVSYLEKELDSLGDPYDVALVAWALTKADSLQKESAYIKLHNMRREDGNRVYWSREPVSFNPLAYEDSQRPYILPKDDQKWDAHAVETTAYALLVYLARDGIGIIQENIVRFLAVMRELDGGLISTLDSVAAMEALVEYSYRARLRDVTDMRIILEHSANPNFTVDLHLGNSFDLASMRTYELENIWGHISVVGHGSGQALVQLDYSYGVDYEPQIDYPPVPAFDFTVETKFFGRNNSHLAITTCSKWTDVEESETSGVAVVEIHLPSGYYVMQDDLIEIVNSRTVRNLRWALRTDTQVKFFFNHLDTQETCLTYEVERWYPVSNHSRYNMARVYDLYQPERFNMTIYELYPLYGLDVCEVCGSYQCPYCPFYSHAISVQRPPLPYFVVVFVAWAFLCPDIL